MNNSLSRIITGTLITLIGLGFLLEAFNLVDVSGIFWTWWPILIIISGVIMVINDAKNYLWSLIVIAVGLVVQLRVLELVEVEPWRLFWPAVLVGIGISILIQRSSVLPKTTKSNENRDDITAILGGSDSKNFSDNFQSSKATVILGGTKLDLRKATIKKSATIEVFVLMGGIELVVPRGVIVNNQLNSILGGTEDKTDQDQSKDAPTITIVGNVIMGGIEIKN